jgi:hypothetical protein
VHIAKGCGDFRKIKAPELNVPHGHRDIISLTRCGRDRVKLRAEPAEGERQRAMSRFHIYTSADQSRPDMLKERLQRDLRTPRRDAGESALRQRRRKRLEQIGEASARILVLNHD